jgi:hypothetical protein
MAKDSTCGVGNNSIKNEKHRDGDQGPHQHNASRVKPEAVESEGTKEHQGNLKRNRNLQ